MGCGDGFIPIVESLVNSLGCKKGWELHGCNTLVEPCLLPRALPRLPILSSPKIDADIAGKLPVREKEKEREGCFSGMSEETVRGSNLNTCLRLNFWQWMCTTTLQKHPLQILTCFGWDRSELAAQAAFIFLTF